MFRRDDPEGSASVTTAKAIAALASEEALVPIWQPDRLYMPDPKTLTSLVKKEVTIDATKHVGSRVGVLGDGAYQIGSVLNLMGAACLTSNP